MLVTSPLTVDQAKAKGLMYVHQATELLPHQFTVCYTTGNVLVASK